MTIQKTCDECTKEIINKNNDNLGYSEWCVFHYKKRRDFCSNKCFFHFFMRRIMKEYREVEDKRKYWEGKYKKLKIGSQQNKNIENKTLGLNLSDKQNRTITGSADTEIKK